MSADHDSPSRAAPRFIPLLELVRARLLEFIRRPEAVFWVYVFPLLMVLALGIAFRNKPVEQVDVAVVEHPLAKQIQRALSGDDRIRVRVGRESTCRQWIRTGKVAVVVRPPEADGGGSSPKALKSLTSVTYWYDPTRPGSLVGRGIVDELLQAAAGRTDVIRATDEEWSEPGGRYIDFLIPGMLGMGLMGGGLWGVGFAIVDMRIRKLLKRFMATPMRRSDFLLGVMISRLLFMLPEMVLLLVFARYAFGVVVYGSYWSVAGLILIGALEFSGIGLLVASRARTLESVSGLMNLTMLPMWVLSGIFFSYERFPEVVHPLIRVLPLTPLIDALRAVMQDGAGFAECWPQLGIMSVWGFVTFGVALAIFRWSD